ncbi:MAG TPA: LPXTG cell wall anchor domain-containing protein [Ruminococcus bromii]|nr:LPXTG cell wall anchor domain-containing protein [Ruminococcus bromii]
MLYKDGKIYSIPSAYNSGVIDDDILTELVDFNIGVMRRYYTVELPPAPPADAKSSSTSDTATKDTLSNSQNNSGVVQTGQNSVAIFLAAAMLAGCGVIFAKRRNYFE